MSEPRTYLHGVTCWVDTEQPDVEAAKAFYGGLFGWSFTAAGPDYSIATFEGLDVGGLGPGPGSWNTYVAVTSADETFAAAVAAGATGVAEPADAGPGGRAAALRDPQGAGFGLWQARARLGSQYLNSPGGWNFSDLRTTDPAAALAFYGSLFGWESAGFAGNEEDGGMVKVPGYGDHLAATSDPEIYERQKNAPPGFADVIGAIVPAAEGEKPHWRVTFTVTDRDASAARAESLGGTVLASSESMWAKLATVRDPAGAEFTVSQFAPPGDF